jgi:hypothetical protein
VALVEHKFTYKTTHVSEQLVNKSPRDPTAKGSLSMFPMEFAICLTEISDMRSNLFNLEDTQRRIYFKGQYSICTSIIVDEISISIN